MKNKINLKLILQLINFKKSKEIDYSFGKINIKLPADHLLPTYQKKHKNYDRFLPHLAKHLNQNDIVIDIGANCGDTLAAMCDSNPALQYICIEADNKFFNFLEENIKSIKSKVSTSITPIKALVGNQITSVKLIGKGGTKKASKDIKSVNDELLYSKSFDDIFEEINQSERSKLRLIKSDVDGFDYDVLNSAMQSVEKYRPIIFFECDYADDHQKSEYLKTINTLINKEYLYFFIFDNFGEFILQTNDIQQIESLTNYVWRQNSKSSTRTVYYFDILCCNRGDYDLLHHAVSSYVENMYK